jgi:hypothetical protein
MLLALPEDALLLVLSHVDGADLGRLALASARLNALLQREAAPWRAALERRGVSDSTAISARRARRAFVELHCRAPPAGVRPRCPGCGVFTNEVMSGGMVLRPMCSFFSAGKPGKVG